MGEDRCEVVLYTPEHDLPFWRLGLPGALKVIDLWAERTRALGARPDVDYVLIFENRGEMAGATVHHPHGQIYGYKDIPPAPLRELVNGFLTLPEPVAALDICAHRDWKAAVPDAAAWPYEILIASESGPGQICDPDLDAEALATVLLDALARLDQLFDRAMPYMLWIHQMPFGKERFEQLPVHIHIAPLLRASQTQRFVGAAEVGGGLYFNPVSPMDAAQHLGDLPGWDPDHHHMPRDASGA